MNTIKCNECGKEVELISAITNMCECGVDYNGFGEQHADRSDWGYETGEDETDMMN